MKQVRKPTRSRPLSADEQALQKRYHAMLDTMRDRKVAYSRIFDVETNEAKLVRDDLARFCREFSSSFHPDPRIHALLEGRREVVLRIKDFLELSVEELVAKYGGPDVSLGTTASA